MNSDLKASVLIVNYSNTRPAIFERSVGTQLFKIKGSVTIVNEV